MRDDAMKSVGVYGLGRFGSYWAQLLSDHFTVVGYSRSPARSTPEGVRRVSEEEVAKQPVLFLCTAISSVEEVARRIAPMLEPGALVIDTCSVKVHPARVMEREFPARTQILATHPMFGPDSGRGGVDGLPMVLCPIRIEVTLLREWKRFFRSLGLTVSVMSPEEHDREAANTQGITHYVGRVLADLDLGDSPIGTLGYRKLLEIREQTCNDPWQLFLDLQRYNPYTREMRERLHRSLDRMLMELDRD